MLAYHKLFTFNKCYFSRYGKYNKVEAVPHIKISSKIIIQIYRAKNFMLYAKILAGSNHFLPEKTEILHLFNLINVAANVNIAKQIGVPKRFHVMVSTFLKPSFHLQVIVFSKVFMQNLSKKFSTRSYLWETVALLHASFNRFTNFLLQK